MSDQIPLNTDAATDDRVTPPDTATADVTSASDADTTVQVEPVDELTLLQRQSETYLNAWKRAAADLQNYKKQQEKQRSVWIAMANQELMLALLPLFDDLHMAINNVTDVIKQSKWYEGLILIQKKQEKALQDAGLETIEADGKPFDPSYHQAVMQESVEGVAAGTVTAVLQAGYLLGGRVLRPAMVKVAE